MRKSRILYVVPRPKCQVCYVLSSKRPVDLMPGMHLMCEKKRPPPPPPPCARPAHRRPKRRPTLLPAAAFAPPACKARPQGSCSPRRSQQEPPAAARAAASCRLREKADRARRAPLRDRGCVCVPAFCGATISLARGVLFFFWSRLGRCVAHDCDDHDFCITTGSNWPDGCQSFMGADCRGMVLVQPESDVGYCMQPGKIKLDRRLECHDGVGTLVPRTVARILYCMHCSWFSPWSAAFCVLEGATRQPETLVSRLMGILAQTTMAGPRIEKLDTLLWIPMEVTVVCVVLLCIATAAPTTSTNGYQPTRGIGTGNGAGYFKKLLRPAAATGSNTPITWRAATTVPSL
eukprot:gene9061-biopygen12183